MCTKKIKKIKSRYMSAYILTCGVEELEKSHYPIVHTLHTSVKAAFVGQLSDTEVSEEIRPEWIINGFSIKDRCLFFCIEKHTIFNWLWLFFWHAFDVLRSKLLSMQVNAAYFLQLSYLCYFTLLKGSYKYTKDPQCDEDRFSLCFYVLFEYIVHHVCLEVS